MKGYVSSEYDKYYRSIGFERRELFSALKKEFGCESVLYPGSSIHITPSFYFSHVVYVDKSVQSAQFFSHTKEVAELIESEKKYQRPAYFEFLPKDFQKNLGIREHSFDLLISLFSGKQIPYSEKYVKKGGMILTSSFFSDVESAEQNSRFELVCSIRLNRGKAQINRGIEVAENHAGKSRLKKSPVGFTYYDDETYYLYRKTVCDGYQG